MKEEIGKRIREIRENMNLTKEDLAKELGMSGQYLGMIEHGKSYLSIEKLKILCELTNLSSDYILFGKDPKITDSTKELLCDFTVEQLQSGCETLKSLAIFIKNSKQSSL